MEFSVVEVFLHHLFTCVTEVSAYVKHIELRFNSYIEVNEYEPYQVFLAAIAFTLAMVWLYNFLFLQELSLWERFKMATFKTLRSLPYVGPSIQREVDKALAGMAGSLFKLPAGMKYVNGLPQTGLSEDQVMRAIKGYHQLGHVDWKKGNVSGTVYSGQPELTQLCTKVYGEFAWSNPLHPDVFPGVRKMEAEVVAMTLKMFNAGVNACGTMTSGGTESILMACLAYRNMAKERSITLPEIVAPFSVHAAFDKAAHYFGMKIIHVSMDPKTWMVSLKSMRRAISSRTCMLVGSAPQFPHGIIDPIADIAALGKRYGIPVHVDACLGGFLLPFMKQAGFDLAPFDFSVDGVTSISCDTHKYGFAPKGSSVILYSDRKYRHSQYFVQPNWPGGVYATSTMAGSRAGAIVAACWATMMTIGEDGYVESTRKIVKAARYIAKELRKVEGIFVFGEPEVSVVAFGSTEFDIYRVSNTLTARGWNLNSLQFPSSIHLCCTLRHTMPGVTDRFITDVKKAVAEAMANPKAKATGQGAIYGMAQAVPDRTLISEIAWGYLDCVYDTKRKEDDGPVNGMHH
ncbi:Sphingosine-1-phosphate lyase 1 [Branchiostoma belcheri]|nr:Sphingosine-1-phosphate lyase 1 [Branchiostoma belcheri]